MRLFPYSVEVDDFMRVNIASYFIIHNGKVQIPQLYFMVYMRLWVWVSHTQFIQRSFCIMCKYTGQGTVPLKMQMFSVIVIVIWGKHRRIGRSLANMEPRLWIWMVVGWVKLTICTGTPQTSDACLSPALSLLYRTLYRLYFTPVLPHVLFQHPWHFAYSILAVKYIPTL